MTATFLCVLLTTTTGTEVEDLFGLYFDDDRSYLGRAWIMLNMVASVDGGTAVDGTSTGLGDEDDLSLFRVLRGISDSILVGAGTVRAEDYGPVRMDEERRRRRIEAGMKEFPRLAIVTGRLSLEPNARVFSDRAQRPLILTLEGVDADRVQALREVAEVVQLEMLDGATIASQFDRDSVVLCEGGPTLNGQLIEAGVVDEVNITLAPMMVSGESLRVAHGEAASPPLDMTLDRALRGDRSLFLRYLNRRENTRE